MTDKKGKGTVPKSLVDIQQTNLINYLARIRLLEKVFGHVYNDRSGVCIHCGLSRSDPIHQERNWPIQMFPSKDDDTEKAA